MLGLKPGRQRYTLLTNEAGGILDDLMVANLGDERLFLVVNASRKDDRLHPYRRQPARRRAAACRSRIARCWRCKGPRAAAVIAPHRRRGRRAAVHGRRAGRRSRGVALPGLALRLHRRGRLRDLASPADSAEALAQRLLDEPEVVPAGLGARDSLRLEAGLCLYGNDIDETDHRRSRPALAWAIGKRRRAGLGLPGRRA